MAIRTGTEVKWNYSGGTATGKVQEIYHEKVTKTCQGNDVTREASDDDPAYLIEQEDGDQVLKSQSEVERADS